MIIDATDLILGRLASFAAKKALLGEEVNIVNVEKAVVSGSKEVVMRNYKRKRSMGSVRKGPFFPRNPEAFVKRTIRGMLPYKQEKGRIAFERVKCFVGVPDKFAKDKCETLPRANAKKLPTLNYGRIGTICSELGGKV